MGFFFFQIVLAPRSLKRMVMARYRQPVLLTLFGFSEISVP